MPRVAESSEYLLAWLTWPAELSLLELLWRVPEEKSRDERIVKERMLVLERENSLNILYSMLATLDTKQNLFDAGQS